MAGRDLLWMDRVAEIMKEVHELVCLPDCLFMGSGQDQHVVDEDNKANAHLTKAIDGWLEKLGGDARSLVETKGHGCVLGIPPVVHQAEVAAVRRADRLVHEEVGDVDLGHHIAAADEGLGCVQPLHLEVLVLDVLVGHTDIEAPTHLVSILLQDREEGAPVAVQCIQGKLLNCTDADPMLQGLAACLEVGGARGAG